MGVNLSIKNAPDEVVAVLREQARQNHRSLQGELLAIITSAASRRPRLTGAEVLERVRALGLSGPSESAEIVREMRDTRNGDAGL